MGDTRAGSPADSGRGPGSAAGSAASGRAGGPVTRARSARRRRRLDSDMLSFVTRQPLQERDRYLRRMATYMRLQGTTPSVFSYKLMRRDVKMTEAAGASGGGGGGGGGARLRKRKQRRRETRKREPTEERQPNESDPKTGDDENVSSEPHMTLIRRLFQWDGKRKRRLAPPAHAVGSRRRRRRRYYARKNKSAISSRSDRRKSIPKRRESETSRTSGSGSSTPKKKIKWNDSHDVQPSEGTQRYSRGSSTSSRERRVGYQDRKCVII